MEQERAQQIVRQLTYAPRTTDAQKMRELFVKAVKQDDLGLFHRIFNAKSSDFEKNLLKEKVTKHSWPLHVACEYQRLEVVRELVEEFKCDVNQVCEVSGYTPLMYAAQVGSLQLVGFLLAQPNIDVEVASGLSGRDALAISRDAGFDRIAKQIEEHLHKPTY